MIYMIRYYVNSLLQLRCRFNLSVEGQAVKSLILEVCQHVTHTAWYLLLHSNKREILLVCW